MSVRFRLRDAAGMLRPPTSQDSKYTRGVVGLMTGSERYPGAGVLSASAALRAGAGYVRYVGPDEVARLLLERHPEAVIGQGRADCWVIGSGLPGLGTGTRAAQMRALLDPAALRAGDADVADLLEGLEPSGAVDGAAAPAIRVVDAGALVDFGSLVLAARRRGIGPDAVDRRPGDEADDGQAGDPVAYGVEGASAGIARDGRGTVRAAGALCAGGPEGRDDARDSAHAAVSAAEGADHTGRLRTVSAARLTPAVRREGFSPFPGPSNPLINRGSAASRSQAGAGADGQDAASRADGPFVGGVTPDPAAAGIAGRGGSPLDPAAFWQVPRQDGPRTGRRGQDAHAADRAAGTGRVKTGRGSGSRRGAAQIPDRDGGTGGALSGPVQGRGDRASRSELQRQLEDARRGHSHPLPGVLARNMVGVSDGRGGDRRAVRQDSRQTVAGRPGDAVEFGAVRTDRADMMAAGARRPRRGTGNRKLYVITPHTGELARLMSSLGEGAVNRGEIESDRRGWAQKAADRLGCVVALKGAHTYVAAPGAALLEVVAPTYWLSTAGTGDVLAGTLGTVLAQLRGDIADGRLDLQHAVALGVYLHGYAGGIASGVIPAVAPHPLTSEPLGMAGGSELVGRPLLAMDVASALPYAVHAVLDAAGSMGPALPPRR